VRFVGFLVNVVSAHNDTCIEDQALSFCVSECSSTVIPFHIVLLRVFAVWWAGPRKPERTERHASARGRALVACCTNTSNLDDVPGPVGSGTRVIDA